ncbi:copper homeostasis membrane protein CopD [Bradyrhizobium sp.]|uniref:copper homeostasis membrane protein CopD n=1 Tax=Bradyrhizobium sp. TaxID=376 RepID=UPI003C31230B
MNWFGAEIDGPIIVARAIHFTASAMIAGGLVFRSTVADPALRSEPKASGIVESQIRRMVWICLPIAVLSGLAWVLVLTMSLSDEGLGEAVTSGALRDVLGLTQFGWMSQIRFALAVGLAVSLVFDRSAPWRWLALGLAVGLMASMAWTGHAASTAHALGYLQLAADTLHLCAAAAWIGGLIPLALLLHAARRYDVLGWAALERDAISRFSSLGIACVAALILSGLINSWILVGSFRGLILTAYGWVLMLKLIVFAVMVALAAVNRLSLMPEMALPSGSERRRQARRRLTRNTVIEIALGVLVFAIVGLLGTLHPAAHLVN